jgi:hypothetical protein
MRPHMTRERYDGPAAAACISQRRLVRKGGRMEDRTCSPVFRDEIERTIFRRALREIAQARLGSGDPEIAEQLSQLEEARTARTRKTRFNVFPAELLAMEVQKDLQLKYDLYFSKNDFLASEISDEGAARDVFKVLGDFPFASEQPPLPSIIPGAEKYTFQELLFLVQCLRLTFPSWLADNMQMNGSWIYVEAGATQNSPPLTAALEPYGVREFRYDGEKD